MQNLQSVNNPIITANQYLLEWKTPSKAHKTLILVEGKDDREFYYKSFKIRIAKLKQVAVAELLEKSIIACKER
ncbi:hypothetical protein DW831_19465 [Bacteroides uniformis]|uniref:Uncharacterized protein n=1 Tax=Bacteroides uniformis TaxID=820 RepID=A0A414BAS0_BACUN|nr:hypothetical protein DW831_19465 [Bacteroides uniformis]